MRKQRKLFLSGFNQEVPLIMHCVSRVVDKQFLLGDEEREVFVGMMRMYEEFCGLRVLSYCVMSNHFHILLEIPPEMDVVELSDDEFMAKLTSVYSEAYVKEIKKLVQKLNKNQATKAMRELKAKYTYRMGNMSEFMKSLKQRFTQWYNRKHGRRGTLWEERYSSTAVSCGSAAKLVSAYIDLNPLRAGMVDDAKDYRWSSYGEALSGGKAAVGKKSAGNRALENYMHLYRSADRSGAIVEELTAEEVLMKYRMLVAEEGAESDQDSLPMRQGERASKRYKKRRGYSRKEIDKILENKGKLSRAEMLRCKTRYFTDGAVIGSKSFVNGFFKRVKEGMAGDRKVGAKPMRKVGKVDTVGNEKLYSFRDLQKDVYGGME